MGSLWLVNRVALGAPIGYRSVLAPSGRTWNECPDRYLHVAMAVSRPGRRRIVGMAPHLIGSRAQMIRSMQVKS